MAGLTPEPRAPERVRGGLATRLAIGAQVLATVALALVAALLVSWLAERPGLRLQMDWTRSGRNTLDPTTESVLDALSGDVAIDVFFRGRAPEPPYHVLGLEVQQRALELVRLVRDRAPDQVTVEQHDLLDRGGGRSRAEARLRELALREIGPGGVIVVSHGKRREVLALRGDLCDLDPGHPGGPGIPPEPPRLVAFRAEEALVNAIYQVADASAPKVLFLAGHGELDAESDDPGGAARLVAEMEGDGFQVAEWDVEARGPIPDECQLLVLLGPEQPLSEAEVRAVQAFVESGGRLFAAAGGQPLEGPGSLGDVLAPFGVRPLVPGLLARPIAQAGGGQLTGIPQCAEIVVWRDGMAAQNPVTEPLRRADRRVRLPTCRALARGSAPPGGTVLDVLRTGDEAWMDRPRGTEERRYDWTPDADEERGPFVVAMEVILPATRPPPAPRAGTRAESRVFVLGSAGAAANLILDANRDLLLNAMNWLVAREHRVRVQTSERERPTFDVTSGDALARVHALSVYALPALALVLGLFTAWKRRRR